MSSARTIELASGSRLSARFRRPLIPAAAIGAVLGGASFYVTATGSRRGVFVLLLLLVPFVLALVGHVERVLLAVVVLDTAFQWDANLGYHADLARLGALGGLNVSASTFALAGLYALWLVDRRQIQRHVARARLALPGLVYLGVLALSITVAADEELAGYEVVLLLQLVLLFVYLVCRLRTSSDVRFLMVMLMATLLLESVVVIVSHFQTSLPLPWTQIQTQVGADGAFRTGGTIGSPNNAGSFLALLLAPTLSYLLLPISGWTRRLAMIAFGVGTAALVFTLSRAGWLSFGISTAVLTFVVARSDATRARAVVAAIAGTFVLVLPFSPLVSARLQHSDRGAARGRIPLDRLAYRMVESKPVLGIGANNFALEIPAYAGPDFSRDWLYTVHNRYLLTWAEAGPAALLAFLWFLLSALARARRTWGTRHLLYAPLALGCGAAIAGQMLGDMPVDPFQSRAQQQLLWVLAALATATYVLAKRKAPE